MNALASILLAGVRSASLVAGVTIRYSRGAESATIEHVLLGKASDLADTEDPNTPRIEHSDRDWFIRPGAIVLNGAQTLPAAFDQIVIIDPDHPSAGKVYEVLPTANGRPFASCDPYETLLRVFTRQVG